MNSILSKADQQLHQMISEINSIQSEENKEILTEISAHLEMAHALIHNNINYEVLKKDSDIWWANLTVTEANEIYYKYFPNAEKVLVCEPTDEEKLFIYNQTQSL